MLLSLIRPLSEEKRHLLDDMILNNDFPITGLEIIGNFIFTCNIQYHRRLYIDETRDRFLGG